MVATIAKFSAPLKSLAVLSARASSGIASLNSVVLSIPSSLTESSFSSAELVLVSSVELEAAVAVVDVVDETDIISSHGHGQSPSSFFRHSSFL